MRQILAYGSLLTIAAMIGAFLESTKRDWDDQDRALHQFVDAAAPKDCAKWSPMDAHKDCKWQRCPTAEDEMQMVCK